MTTAQQHIASGGGICGTCASPAQATADNQGYSSCCNDRIEYGLEASETLAQATCAHTHTHTVRERATDPGYYIDTTYCTDCDSYIDETWVAR